jgi:hypothetical protein
MQSKAVILQKPLLVELTIKHNVMSDAGMVSSLRSVFALLHEFAASSWDQRWCGASMREVFSWQLKQSPASGVKQLSL